MQKFIKKVWGAMGKNIVLLSDGTGNSSSKLLKTNVWRMYQAIDLTGVDQIAYYDDGVGTSTFKPFALLGGAFGWGLKRNVLQLYTFLCRQYEEGDRIYGFGFSRGAFTIRLLVGFVSYVGLVKFASEEELQRNARIAYRAYRKHCSSKAEGGPPVIARLGRAIRDAWWDLLGYLRYEDVARRPVDEIAFLGLWDTVAAYGMPIDEMAQAIDRHIWPLSFPDTKLSPKVKRACHALSLDDERRSFHPVLWDERDEAPRQHDAHGHDTIYGERISQVWFAGMHANVGGGYSEDGLAHVALVWVMDEAVRAGLVLNHVVVAPMRRAESLGGKMYDSRAGIGLYYRYQPRSTQFGRMGKPFLGPGGHPMRPKVHDSVVARINMAIGGYAPLGLPDEFDVVTAPGRILPMQASRGAPDDQEAARMIDDMVWLRRLLYLLLLAISLFLVASPCSLGGASGVWTYYTTSPILQYAEVFIYALLRLPIEALALVLPSYASPWIETFRAYPLMFVALVAIGVAFWAWSAKLQWRIGDTSRFRWSNGWGGAVPPPSAATRIARVLRNTPWLVTAYRLIVGRAIPGAIAIGLIVAVPYGIYSFLAGVLAAVAGSISAAP